MHEASSARRLAAWGSAALAGAVSLDEASTEVAGADDPDHRIAGLPGEDEAVNVAYALGRLRTLGAIGLRLVLPGPGDVAGLPGPPSFNERAVERGAAVIAVGADIGLLPEHRSAWSAHVVLADRRTPRSVRDAARDLNAATRAAAEELTRLDLARFEPGAAALIAEHSRSVRPELPWSVSQEAHSLLQQALRLTAVVQVASAFDGAAISAFEATARSAVLRELDTAARRAVEAACSPQASD